MIMTVQTRPVPANISYIFEIAREACDQRQPLQIPEDRLKAILSDNNAMAEFARCWRDKPSQLEKDVIATVLRERIGSWRKEAEKEKDEFAAKSEPAKLTATGVIGGATIEFAKQIGKAAGPIVAGSASATGLLTGPIVIPLVLAAAAFAGLWLLSQSKKESNAAAQDALGEAKQVEHLLSLLGLHA